MKSIDPPKWLKSSYCSGGQCVEVTKIADQFLIRDSKRPDMAPLSFNVEEWAAFVRGVAEGEFHFQ